MIDLRIQYIQHVHVKDRLEVRFVLVSIDKLTQTPKLSVAPGIAPLLDLPSLSLKFRLSGLDSLHYQKRIECGESKQEVNQKINSADVLAMNLFVFFHISALNQF